MKVENGRTVAVASPFGRYWLRLILSPTFKPLPAPRNSTSCEVAKTSVIVGAVYAEAVEPGFIIFAFPPLPKVSSVLPATTEELEPSALAIRRALGAGLSTPSAPVTNTSESHELIGFAVASLR